MLIAEDLLLLFTDDDTGRSTVDGTKLSYALAGAILLELALDGKLDIAEKDERVKAGRLIVRDETPPENPVLADRFGLLREKEGGKPSDVLGKLHKGLREQLLDGLAARGILRKDQGKVLGLFPTTRWPAEDSRHEDDVRRKLHDVLVGGAEPEPRTGALVSLLVAVDSIGKAVESDDKRALKRRAKQIAEGEWAGTAVRKAVDSMNAAMMTAITASIAASTAATNS